MAELTTTHVTAPDGTRIAVHRMGPEDGSGRPVLMLHGLFSSAEMNWVKYGHAPLLAANGFDCIMPDWRVHGLSDSPTDPETYASGVLADDAAHIMRELGLTDYDLVGFSLGARTAVSAVVRGLAPRRLVLGGMGLEGLTGWRKRVAFFVDMVDRYDEIERGDVAFLAKSFMKAQGIDRVAARLLLTRAVEDITVDEIGRIAMPTLVLIGEDDRDNGSPQRLAEALPEARVQVVPGNHMGSVTKKDLGQAILDFLQ
ncbi:alpha/beta fold hydrolase [Aurantiacibacter gangjinensis]|uniref:Hydrolase n=1 Tax=Aurantiacibacter gangjinensis TaxID=502682 RepID=A0A0G9MQ50_9SPHN|nr:alpha/beta fold hydrolase [Aurantiacibacter gangjinensis]APE28489.1 Hydrolase [Aurantiacibacter gangjinensis]KLE32694.1 hydrolase [Aurantiacibacter gangjinensis]